MPAAFLLADKEWETLCMRDLSSAGRASVLQTEGHRFEPYRSHEPSWYGTFVPRNKKRHTFCSLMPMWLNWQSSWFVISRLSVRVRSSALAYKRLIWLFGWIPEWPKGTDCKSAANCFGGSNPPPSILWASHRNAFRRKSFYSWEEHRLYYFITRGGAVWKLVGLITRRS